MRKSNRIVSFILALVMCLSLFTASAASKANSVTITSATGIYAGSNYKITWSYSGSRPKGYLVAIRDLSTDTKVLENTWTTSKSYTVPASKLCANHQYRVWCASYESKGGKLLAQTTITLNVTSRAAEVKAPSVSISAGKKSATVKFKFKVTETGGSTCKTGIMWGYSADNLCYTISAGSVKKATTVSTSKSFSAGTKIYYKSFAGSAVSSVESLTIYACPWCSYCGSFASVYAHCWTTGQFKKNSALKTAWECGLIMIEAAIDNPLGKLICQITQAM